MRLDVASIVFLAAFFYTRASAADTIRVMWDQNPEPQVVGYMVHVGTQSGQLTQHYDAGLTTTWSLTTAIAGQRYCFAVSAYIRGKREGPRSTEVCGYSNTPTLVNPGTRSSTRGQATTLQLVGQDPSGRPVSYSASGLPAGLSLMASTGFISGTPSSVGSSSVTATVSNGLRTASQTFSWAIVASDTTAPTVAITGPTSASTHSTTATTLTVNGTANDNVGVTRVNWVNNRGGSGTAAGTTAWSVAGIPLQSGTNLLTVTALDAAGNSASDALTVTSSPATLKAPLQATLVSSRTAPQPIRTKILLTASASGSVTPYQYRWRLLSSSGSWLLSNWTSAHVLTWIPQKSNSTFQIELSVRSASGNQVTVRMPFPVQQPIGEHTAGVR